MRDEYGLLRSFGAIDRSKLQSRALKTMRDKALLDSRSALRYAIYVRQGRWAEGEPLIATNGGDSFSYAKNALGGRFLAGEEAIRSNGIAAEGYALEVLEKEWPEAEVNIFDPKQNHRPGEYYETFLSGVDYDDLSEPVQRWLIREHGECGNCGNALPASKRDRWHINDGFAHEEYCSERCANNASEYQHEADLEYWAEEAMHEAELDPAPTPERVTEAQKYIKNYHQYLDGPGDVERALVKGGFIPDPEEEPEDEDEG